MTLRILSNRQSDGKHRALFLRAMNGQFSSVIFNDAETDAQAQSVTHIFGRKKWIENLFLIFQADAGPVIGENDINCPDCLILNDTNFDLAARGQGFHGVDDEIHEDLLKLILVKDDVGEIIGKVPEQFNILKILVMYDQVDGSV